MSGKQRPWPWYAVIENHTRGVTEIIIHFRAFGFVAYTSQQDSQVSHSKHDMASSINNDKKSAAQLMLETYNIVQV